MMKSKMKNLNLYLHCEPQHCYNRGIKKFYSVLDRKIDLNGKWEVSLTEISFTKSFYNITEDQYVDLIFPIADFTGVKSYRINKTDQYIRAGEWSIDNLIEEINSVIHSHFPSPSNFNPFNLIINSTTYFMDGETERPLYTNNIPYLGRDGERFFINSGVYWGGTKMLFFVLPSEKLCEILGFDREELLIDAISICDFYMSQLNNQYSERTFKDVYKNDRKIYSKYQYKIFEKPNKFFVCSDICEPMCYGEVLQPILRQVRFDEAKCGDKITYLFENPYYFKLKKNPFQLIEIKLMDNLNYYTDTEVIEKEFNFQFGEIYLGLNFRQISEKETNYQKEIEREVIRESDEVEVEDEFETDVFHPDHPPDLPRPRINP